MSPTTFSASATYTLNLLKLYPYISDRKEVAGALTRVVPVTKMSSASPTNASRRRTLAFLTSNAGLGDSYQGALRWGVEQACTRHDADLLVYVGRTNWSATGDHHKLYYFLDPNRIDAIVFASGVLASYVRLEEVIENIRKRCPVPICSVGQYCRGIPNILIDNSLGTGRLVDHLVVHHGYRHFACITGPKEHEESAQRLLGTRTSLERHDIRLSPEAVVRGDFSMSSGRDAVNQLLQQGTQFDAIVCGNDDMAFGALDAIKAAGLRCPEDIVIAGFDDAAGARFSTPPLTTVRQPATRLGATAVDFIMRILDDRTAGDTITLPTELIIRESCGCHPGGVRSHVEWEDESPRRSPIDELSCLLSPLYTDDHVRDEWIAKLVSSVTEEVEGKSGTFCRTLDAMLNALPYPHLPLHEMQWVIARLSQWAETLDRSTEVDRAFQMARVMVGDHMYRRAGEKQLRNDALVDELRISWERFATALSLSVLKTTLLLELPRLGIQNGAVSLFESANHKHLIPWICFLDGTPVVVPTRPYPAELIFPEQMPLSASRRSMTILPLTFEAELFGIAALELPIGLDAYALLREQISTTLRTVQKHEGFLAKERLRVKVEEERRLANERLRSLSVIAGGVAHDLNNVLGPMVALPDTIELDLLDKTDIPEDVFEDLELIRHASQRAAHTIGDLFLLGKPQDTPKTYLSLNHLLSKEADSFRAPPGREEISVKIDIEHRDLVIQGSKSHITRAISNLVINASKAIEREGMIHIVAKQVRLRKTLAGHTPIPRGTYAVVEVRDNGCGIPEEHLPRIMEPFFTASHNPNRTGSGLGLAIVLRIVKESQGHIHVESAPGKGSSFSLYFPLADHQVAPSPPPSEIVGGNERILVVDDETVQLRAAQRILKHLGYDVTTVQSGEAAIGLFENGASVRRFDLVIVDMLMPGLDGIETVERIRQYHPGQRAIIASGYAPEQMSITAAERGMAWLAKPYTLPILAEAVRGALNEAKTAME